MPSRDELWSRYLDTLPYEPYPVQERALLDWFEDSQGVLVCAPTGTGKTLIAEAAMFEALHTRRVAYYTTPLIALTEQKFREMQESAVRWGFDEDDVGLVTGNRTVNPDARVLVVVAEILLNRLLHPAAFDFADVDAVVMDEFHSFNDAERGVVWELSLTLLPEHVRTLLLSATVGNSVDFLTWLREKHHRKLRLVQSDERKVPLRYQWVGEQLLNEQLEEMADGEDANRRTPALLFCFNRDQCWDVAEQLKGKSLVDKAHQKALLEKLDEHEWNRGVAPKLKQILLRGVGVHHAGILPRYRRIVEDLFQQKLLQVCVCTETLAAGINLPARSVVLTTLLKGPPGKKKLCDPSSAHQMFGRAGRPQFDDAGYVYALAHEDDVKIARYQERIDQIPEDTRDPHLIKARKRLEKKAPKRRQGEQYWDEKQFEKLIASPPGNLASRGHLPWRLLAYLLTLSPEVERLRTFVDNRLLFGKQLEASRKQLRRMLLTLWAGGYVELEPEPPAHLAGPTRPDQAKGDEPTETEEPEPEPGTGLLGNLIQQARETGAAKTQVGSKQVGAPVGDGENGSDGEGESSGAYEPEFARPTESLADLLVFRSVNPLYGVFLVRQLDIANFEERVQALESVLEMPGSVARYVRVPWPDRLPPGPLATGRLDDEIVQWGLAPYADLYPPKPEDQPRDEPMKFPVPLAEKLRMLFDAEYPGVHSLRTTAVWAAGDMLNFGCDFNAFISSRSVAKQEGVIFRHLLRMILLCGEFQQLAPPGCDPFDWQRELTDLAQRLTAGCRAVDPESTDKAIEEAAARAKADVVDVPEVRNAQPRRVTSGDEFGAGLE